MRRLYLSVRFFILKYEFCVSLFDAAEVCRVVAVIIAAVDAVPRAFIEIILQGRVLEFSSVTRIYFITRYAQLVRALSGKICFCEQS